MKKSIAVMIGIIVAAMIVVLIVGAGTVVSSANTNPEGAVKRYANIEVQQNDTLWSIAEKYSADCGMSVQNYVSEVKELNQMNSDYLVSGSYLIVMTTDH